MDEKLRWGTWPLPTVSALGRMTTKLELLTSWLPSRPWYRGDAAEPTLHGGLGLLPGSVCPHYDSEPGRRPSYRAAVMAGQLPAGWAVEDGAGALFEKGVPTEAVTRAPGAEVYRVEPDGSGGAREQGLPCRALTPSRSLERPER